MKRCLKSRFADFCTVFLWISVVSAIASPPANAQIPTAESGFVQPGIDVLASRGFDVLRGQRVGLVTNQTGRTRGGRATIDVLRAAPDVKLVALYAPEHGVRGEIAAGAHVGSYRDITSGLPVFSLYGATRKPTPAMLRGVQTLVFDIQEIGARSYTFSATLKNCLEACAEQKIAFVVLDRPNPLGNSVEGNIPAHFSFVCPAPIPYRHGLTMGELARFFNARLKTPAALSVVPMLNYRRSMTWGQTGLSWVRTSPNIPLARSAFFYQATGLLGELPPLSIGIGTPWPFELAGAPGLNADALARELKNRRLPGWGFEAFRWTPAQGRFSGKRCAGVKITLLDAAQAQATRLDFELFDAVRRIAPKTQFFNSARNNAMFDKICGTSQIRRAMQSGQSASELWNLWNHSSASFERQSASARLYGD